MILRSVVRDCLFVNWALPVAALPAPPPPLSYQIEGHDGEDFVFASALLFRHDQVRLASVPWARVSHPQFNLRLCTVDADGVPSVLFLRMLVPAWVVPAARLMVRHGLSAGRFRYPSAPSLSAGAEVRWSVRRGGALEILARAGAMRAGRGPRIGGFEETVAYFRRRPLGYAPSSDGSLTRFEASFQAVEAVPVAVEIESADLLASGVPVPLELWGTPHSAWFCPEIPFVFEVLVGRELALRRQAPAPG